MLGSKGPRRLPSWRAILVHLDTKISGVVPSEAFHSNRCQTLLDHQCGEQLARPSIELDVQGGEFLDERDHLSVPSEVTAQEHRQAPVVGDKRLDQLIS